MNYKLFAININENLNSGFFKDTKLDEKHEFSKRMK